MTLEQLMERAIAGKAFDRKRMFRASNMYGLMKEPFGIWCDYFGPAGEKVKEEYRYDDILKQNGIEFENKWISENYPGAVTIEPEWGEEALENTLKAMVEGAAAIHSASLWSLEDEIYGKADLLVRRDDLSSDLGEYYYQVKEIKRASVIRDHHSMQAILYNRILGKLQGYTPPAVSVVLPEREGVVHYEDFSARLGELLGRWRSIRDGRFKPEPGGLDKVDSPWRVYANKILVENRDLTLLPDVGPATREKLRLELGVRRIDDLYQIGAEILKKLFEDKLGTSIYYHARAYREGKPVIVPGKTLAFPRRKRHLYFDFETSGDLHPEEPEHCYLVGLWDAEEGKYIPFLAKGSAEEQKIFRSFIEYAGNPADACLYHWSDYEVRILEDISARWPELAGGLEALKQSCIDLKEVIKQQVYLPVPTYSIKSVAPFLGFNWRQKDVDALESMVLYWDYLKGDEQAVKKAVDYNEDDCRAMAYSDFKICQMFGLSFPGKNS